jgi:hypothetical protein
MDAAVEAMEAQLELWSSKIDQFAAKVEIAGAQAGFDVVTYIDELKALRAIAQSRLVEFKAAVAVEDARQARLKAAMKRAWNELDAAFKNGQPLP